MSPSSFLITSALSWYSLAFVFFLFSFDFWSRVDLNIFDLQHWCIRRESKAQFIDFHNIGLSTSVTKLFCAVIFYENIISLGTFIERLNNNASMSVSSLNATAFVKYFLALGFWVSVLSSFFFAVFCLSSYHTFFSYDIRLKQCPRVSIICCFPFHGQFLFWSQEFLAFLHVHLNITDASPCLSQL